MATVPKPTAVASAGPAQAARAVSAPTRVAAVSTSQVDALNAGTNISFDAAASGFQDSRNQSLLDKEEGSRRQYSDPGFDRLFTADTNVFATIFEAQDKEASGSNDRSPAGRALGRPVSSVIKTYETNALIISGQQPVNGTAFSFSL
ncbi:MAG: hypothetical protein JJ900_07130 [Rhodospirillales bacterium]|nr:hypothetical protein [Rhodospirillales bacterium]MBO6786610.1 hypothetical protein [Rhodospirillales bacterium]